MTELSQPFVFQHTLDALGRWAKRATGITVAHGEQGITKPLPPYVSLEWIDKLAQAGPKIEYEISDAWTSATFTVTAAAESWAALAINLARPALKRTALETLTAFADRLAAEARAFVTGRLVVTRVGAAGIVITAVAAGDLYHAAVIEGATVVTAGTGTARIVERLYRGTVRVWVIGATATSGEAGIAGLGLTTSELLAALMEGLDRPWCRELFDSFTMRRTGEPVLAPAQGRRLGSKREGRSYFDLPLGVTARFALAAEAVADVPFALATLATPDGPDTFRITATTGDTLEI